MKFHNAYSTSTISHESRVGADDQPQEQIENPREDKNDSSSRSINHESTARSTTLSSHRDYSPPSKPENNSPPPPSSSSLSTYSHPGSNSDTSNSLPPKGSNKLPITVNIPRGKNPPAKDEDKFDDCSYKLFCYKDYDSYIFSEKNRKEVNKFIVEL